MKGRQAAVLGQLALAVALGAALWSAAQDQARANALSSFRHYRADWEEAWRDPVERLAMATLGDLLSHPERDPERAEAALSVMRRSQSWYAMSPDVASPIKGWIDARLLRGEGDGDQLHAAFDLLELAESDEVDSYRARIAALAGDRHEAAAQLAASARELGEHIGSGDADLALARLALAWRELHAVQGGRHLNWLAQRLPAIAAAEQQATVAAVGLLRKLLEPYLGKAAGAFGETLPDEAMLSWLDRQAVAINHEHPEGRDRVRKVRAVLAEFAPHYHFEPLIDAACATVLRYHAVPTRGLLIALAVAGTLSGGLWFALIRLVRGPKPVDVNAETMENVEPIDLDTDAETKSRSSASITDVG
jgi:hypothetical protein